jgi:uncharacterized protein (UPF0248 family)
MTARYVSPKDVLNKLKWKEGESLTDATIYYVSRGSPGDSASVNGSEIKNIEPFGFELESGAFIPYHRIYRIEYRGKDIFDRQWYQYTQKL